MNFKSTYVLFGILLVTLIVFNLAVWLAPVKAPDASFVFPSAQEASSKVSSSDLTKITLENKKLKQKLVFSREKDKPWTMDSPEGFRANPSLVDRLGDQVLNARRQKADISSDLGRWDLNKPPITVTLEGKGKTFTLYLGKHEGDQVFATSTDFPDEPMVILADQIEQVFKGVNDYRKRSLLANTESDIQYIELSKGNGEPVIVKNEDSRWQFVQPGYGDVDYEGASGSDPDKAPTGLRDVLQGLANLEVVDKAGENEVNGFVADNVTDAKVLKDTYGLDAQKNAAFVLKVKKKAADKEETTLWIGKKVEGDNSDHYYARLADYPHIFRVDGKQLKPVRLFIENPEEVRDHALVRLSKDPNVIRLEYHPSGRVLELIKKDGGVAGQDKWSMHLGKDEVGRETDDPEIERLVNSIRDKRLIKDFPEKGSKDAELGEKVVVMSAWTDGIKKDEKKDPKKDGKDEKKPTIKCDPEIVLTFGRQDFEKKTVVVQRKREDKSQTVQVADSVLELVAQSPLTYLGRRLPNYTTNPEDATRLVIKRSGETVEAVKGKKDSVEQWMLKSPADVKDRRADAAVIRNILTTLNGVQVHQWTKLDATDEDLKRYGLTTPELTVSITLKGKEKPVEFLIGNKTDKGENYYAKRGDDKTVFEISNFLLLDVRKPLMDLNIFTFSPSEVKKLQLKGWKKHVGQAVVRNIEREGSDGWKITEPKDLSVNESKIDKLVAQLSFLKAQKFVVYKKGPQPSHGLDVNKEALSIEITLNDDKKKPLTLMIGDEKDGSYYASSSAFPGDVFAIEKASFEEYLRPPGQLGETENN